MTRRRVNWLAVLPLAVFAALAVIFLVRLLSGRDPAAIPSALIGRQAPSTRLPPLEGVALPGLDSRSFAGTVTLVNIWASWCVPCREEQPLLMKLAEDDRFVLAGLNYKDQPGKARDFLATLGNPFDAVGVDVSGRAGIDWGLYGVPETFLVGKDGTILWKQVGPFDAETLAHELMPRIDAALAAN